MKYITTDTGLKAAGPYSLAISTEHEVFCSGQIGTDPDTDQLADGFEAQVHQAIKNLKTVLEAAHTDLDKVIKTTLFLTDINNFAKVNEIYAEYFPVHKPARSTVAVAALPKGALFEIEAIAAR